MAHFAKLGKGNIIEKVEVVHNDIAITEQDGVDFIPTIGFGLCKVMLTFPRSTACVTFASFSEYWL